MTPDPNIVQAIEQIAEVISWQTLCVGILLFGVILAICSSK